MQREIVNYSAHYTRHIDGLQIDLRRRHHVDGFLPPDTHFIDGVQIRIEFLPFYLLSMVRR